MLTLMDNRPVLAVPATSTITAEPDHAAEGVYTGRFWLVRALVAYQGNVDGCALRWWFRDPSEGGAWYRGPSTDDFEPLVVFGGGYPDDEAREERVGAHQEVYVQVERLSGIGTVAVRLQPVQTA